MREVWTERAMVQSWLDVEAAIAWAQGELGIIPKRTASTIVRHCDVATVTPASIARYHNKTGHVIVSLVKAFRDAAPDVGELFHFGPTTQDILDTGLTLQIRDGLRILVPALSRLQETLNRQAWRYRSTVMAGRTEGQIAAPITYGHKLAVLASELSDHMMRLAQSSERLMWVTLFGATGVQSSFSYIADQRAARKMLRLVAKRLGLQVPSICMHHRTDRFAELACVLAGILSTLGEAGLEIRDLQRSEVGEIAEPWSDDQHSSSTMPQKQNPEVSEWLEGLAKLGRGYAVSLLDIQQQHERDISRLPPELHAIPNLFLHSVAAVESANFVFGGLRVFKDRMQRNLLLNGGLIMSEAFMLLLAKTSRRKVWAHQLCHDIAMEAARSGHPIIDLLASKPEVTRYLSMGQIRAAFDPANYIGTAVSQVEDTVALCRRCAKASERILRSMLRCGAARGRQGKRRAAGRSA
ncbi:MAG: adenylosuccinate lyase family protein [Gammaproteobacteria bacterium]|nr:adenylosuccinate lyase family protein [Gammaproteobacteria bacterium]